MGTENQSMENKGAQKRIGIREILIIQAVVIVYTLSGVASKLAAGYPFMSVGFILCYGAEMLILGIYAVLWQQIIKRFDLSVAYANRSVALLWSMVWAVSLFHETVTVKNLLGVAIVIAGTMIVNSEANEGGAHE